MKLTKRKGFNFFRSYYDVYNELNDKDKVQFINALFDRQFLGVKPTDLTGMAKFAYISQTNSIDSQVKGYEDKTGTKLQDETTPPTVPPSVGVKNINLTPTLQVQEKVQVQVQEKGKVKEKVKELLDKRKLKFAESLEIHLETFGKDLLNNFFHYWTEHNDEGKKMRFEYAKNQPFNVKRCLTSWQSRNKENANFKGNKKRGEGVDAEYMNELKTRLYGNK